jgi:rhamnulokinase
VLSVAWSIAESYRRTLEDLERTTGLAYERVHLIGGGSRNAMLCRLTARLTGREVVAGPAEATALGNLLIQARAMGDLPDEQSIRDIAAASGSLQVYCPDDAKN